MDKARNGILAGELPSTLNWRKSVRSGPNGGNCVELATLPGGEEIAVRNSRFPEGPALIYTVAEIKALVEGAKDGEFDDMIA
ncbi:DUF397 domain-containing protein [Glycomyces algeriensis]|jgi:hypothetical protein|uniref:Transcriptional regulator n=1 Tax=Glycomyces algeriensis TaxID=256037 RepID=A0A9W6G744_9ACTN|nr:DUF397 domain-containing protein [Glycomyces algeriensis]MDA1368542.1 DUF397 domain-containing protein [Glycomyces algeriensis]MDR7348806.1 hypothetical protein [Glycomyces algeriensis]GLI41508.1 transcriptional regulator [Glycomyces algeriensis]